MKIFKGVMKREERGT